MNARITPMNGSALVAIVLPIGVRQQLAYQRIMPFADKPHGRDLVGARREPDVRLRHLRDLRAAVRIENVVGTAEEVRERLAVVAIAEAVVDGARRHVARDAAHGAAAATQSELRGLRHARCSVLERRELARGVHDLAAEQRQHGLDVADLFERHREVVRRQHGEVRELAGLERAAHVVVEREPGAPQRVEAQRRLAGPAFPRARESACRRRSCRRETIAAP